MSTLVTLHSAVDSADLNYQFANATKAPTDATAPVVASTKLSLPSQADLGPKVTKKLATEKHVPVPQSWGGLHRQLTIGIDELSSFGMEPAAAPAVVKSDTPAPALELEEVHRANPPEMLPAHELVRQHRLSRDDRDATNASITVHSWSGISASLEAEYGGQAADSPAAARPTVGHPLSAPTAVAVKPAAVVPAVQSVAQPVVALRPPRTIAMTSAAPQSSAWLGLSNALTTEFNNPSPSPPPRRRAAKRVEAPMNVADKENASNDIAEITNEVMIPTKAPPATSFGYADLSPLSILGH